MHNCHRKLTAWLIPYSLILTSCFNPYTGGNTKSILVVENQNIGHPVPKWLFTTADGKQVWLMDDNPISQAIIQAGTSTQQVPVIFKSGYTLQKLIYTQAHIQSKLVHIVVNEQGDNHPMYVYIGKGPKIIPTKEDNQPLYYPTTEISHLNPAQVPSSNNHALLDSPASISIQNINAIPGYVENPSTHMPGLSSATKQPTIYQPYSSDKQINRRRTNSLAVIKSLCDRQQSARNKANQPVHITSIKQPSYIIPPYLLSNIPSTKEMEFKPFIAQGGHQVTFKHSLQGQYRAQVNESLGPNFSRTLYLPVHIEHGFGLNRLAKHGMNWQKQHIYVCFPEKDERKGLGYVYVGCSGLLGGSPAKATPGITNILVKHQGPFHFLQPADNRIMVKEVQFMPQMGFWWAEITYAAYSNDTKRYKKEILATIRLPVDAEQLEPFYAEDIARAQVTIHYSIDNPSLARSVPNFHSIKITKSSSLPSSNQKNTSKLEKSAKTEITELEGVEEIERIEKAAYEAFIQSLNNTLDSQDIMANTQQQLQEVLHRLDIEGTNLPLEAEARALKNYLVELLKVLKVRHKATHDLYFGPSTSDYINQRILQGFKELNTLEQNIQSTENSLKILCHTFHFEIPSYNLELPVNLKALLGIVCNKSFLLNLIDTILETQVPGGQLIQIILGHIEQPQTWEEYLPVAIETALDFLPRGKASRFLKLLSGRTVQTEFKRLIIKQAKKKAKQLKQANKKKKEAVAKETHQGKH